VKIFTSASQSARWSDTKSLVEILAVDSFDPNVEQTWYVYCFVLHMCMPCMGRTWPSNLVSKNSRSWMTESSSITVQLMKQKPEWYGMISTQHIELSETWEVTRRPNTVVHRSMIQWVFPASQVRRWTEHYFEPPSQSIMSGPRWCCEYHTARH